MSPSTSARLRSSPAEALREGPSENLLPTASAGCSSSVTGSVESTRARWMRWDGPSTSRGSASARSKISRSRSSRASPRPRSSATSPERRTTRDSHEQSRGAPLARPRLGTCLTHGLVHWSSGATERATDRSGTRCSRIVHSMVASTSAVQCCVLGGALQFETACVTTSRRSPATDQPMIDIEQALSALVACDGSDLHLKVRLRPARAGRRGPRAATSGDDLAGARRRRTPRTRPPSRWRRRWAADGRVRSRPRTIDLRDPRAWPAFASTRLRQRGRISIVARAILTLHLHRSKSWRCPAGDQRSLAEEQRGLILVTGTTRIELIDHAVGGDDQPRQPHPCRTHRHDRGPGRVRPHRPPVRNQPARGRHRHGVLQAPRCSSPFSVRTRT